MYVCMYVEHSLCVQVSCHNTAKNQFLKKKKFLNLRKYFIKIRNLFLKKTYFLNLRKCFLKMRKSFLKKKIILNLRKLFS